jgi:type IV pilus assembly protein PilY1
MCYEYVYNATTPANSYFKPVSEASAHVCSGKWSGNYLNYASMQTLDEFRWIMTGGYRSVDTNTSSTNIDTVLTKTWSSSDKASKDNVPNKTTSLVSGATPFSWSSATTRIWGLGSRMWITKEGAIDTATSAIAYGSQRDDEHSKDKNAVYEVYINVAACVSADLKEDNCVQYGKAYKPEGLMQQYAMQLRFSAFGYLFHSGTEKQQRDGGVLRARMNYIGPYKPVPGKPDVPNDGAPEWDAATGIMKTNPAADDAADTNSTFDISVSNSGAMNYLNKFGYSAKDYKSKDPVSELYNTVLRYYKGLGNVDSYTTGTTAAYADGFPVITKWRKVDSSTMGADPIVYSCQKNFILGIGDVNAHRDANLQGSTLRSSLEPTLPSEIAADTSVNVTTATDMVGTLEGKAGLGGIYGDTSSGNCWSIYNQCHTYYIAGLAYDAHTGDLRSTLTGPGYTADNDMSDKQTVNTYWLDVMENQTYKHKNQYWLAAKYGGFKVPSGFSPYASSNGTSTLPLSSWYNNSDTSAGLSITSGLTFTTDVSGDDDKRPDNYFFGNSPATMKSGLITAFSKIARELDDAHSATYVTPSPNVGSGDGSYASSYSPATWTSSVVGAMASYDARGVVTVDSRLGWDARDKLEARSDPRVIVTYCDATPTGIPFSAKALAKCPTTGRLNYASFAKITDATSKSSTAAADYLAYVRGSRANEIGASVGETTDHIYRQREFLLGDIVNAKVNAVGHPVMTYYDVYNPGYSSFKRNYANRRTVVYAASNDGMLHAFDGTLPGYIETKASDGSTTKTVSDCPYCGQELFAYIPSFVYGTKATAASTGLASFGSPTRTHHYLVDATPLEIDLDISNVCATGTNSTTTQCRKAGSKPDWRTLLIGGLGKGGKGFYALDVTNPGSVTTTSTTSGQSTTVAKVKTDGDWTSEEEVAKKVLWEFPNSTDSVTIGQMGFSYGAPTFLKTRKYGWVVVFTSGYNNSDGKGYFFFVNPRTGALLETVATPEGSASVPLNLAQADAYVPNHSDFTGDAIYAGDLQGNLWRVDVSGIAAYGSAVKMATLYKKEGVPQPVTTRPLIEIDPMTSKRYVMVGTGRLLADSDIASTAVQSIYSVYDGTKGLGDFQEASVYSTPLTRTQLVANTNVLEGIGSSPSSPAGWYIDLPISASAAERVNVDPVANAGVAAFAVNLPNTSVCSPSGTGYAVAINVGNGKSVLQSSGVGFVAKSDTMKGLITDVAIQNVNGKLRMIVGDSQGTTITPPAALSTGGKVKRMNWREVPTQ